MGPLELDNTPAWLSREELDNARERLPMLYGIALNLMFWPFTTGLGGGLSFIAGAPVLENLHRFLVFSFATSLGWDMGRALTNIVLVCLTGSVVLRTLRRAARKAAFEAPVVFTPATTRD